MVKAPSYFQVHKKGMVVEYEPRDSDMRMQMRDSTQRLFEHLSCKI